MKAIDVGGAPVFVDPAPGIPLVTVVVAARGGAAGDPEGLAGRAHHIAELAVRGAGRRDRAAIDEAFDQLGTNLSVSTSRDSISYALTCLADNLEPACALLAEVLGRPRFDAGEHRKLVRESLADLDDLRDDDYEVAARCFDACFAPGHPYGRAIEGDARSLEALAAMPAADLGAVYAAQVRAANLVIGLAGAVDRDRAAAAAETLVAGLGSAAPPEIPVELSDPSLPDRCRIVLVDKPERSQSQILAGHRGPRFGTRDATAMALVEAAFGGMFTSRLMREVRVARGWSYNTSMQVARARGSQWARMSLAPSADTTAAALELVVDLYRQLGAGGLDSGELELARRFVSGSVAMSRATARQRIHAAVTARTLGLPDGWVEGYAERIDAITADHVAAAIDRHVHPDSLTIAVVATAARVAEPLRALGIGDVEVVDVERF